MDFGFEKKKYAKDFNKFRLCALTYRCICLHSSRADSCKEHCRCFRVNMNQRFRMGIVCKCPEVQPIGRLNHDSRSDRMTAKRQKVPNNFHE